MSDSIAQLKSNPNLQSAIRNLVPYEAAHSENHPLWKRISFKAFQDYNYYITNLQGDVISLETTDGMQGAHYYYDAWGEILSSSGDLAELNPLRYRG